MLEDVLMLADFLNHFLRFEGLFFKPLARLIDIILFFSDPFLNFKAFLIICPRCELLSPEEVFLGLLFSLDDLFSDLKKLRVVLNLEIVHLILVTLKELLEGLTLKDVLVSSRLSLILRL
jgi:hypothetical protein